MSARLALAALLKEIHEEVAKTNLSESPLLPKLDKYFRQGGSVNDSIKCSTTSREYPLLNYFAKRGFPLVVNMLLLRGAHKESVDGEALTPLQQVTSPSNKLPEPTVLRIVQDLLRAGADVDASASDEDPPLTNAILSCMNTVVDEICGYEPEVNVSTQPLGQPLASAAFKGLVQVAESLLKAGADINGKLDREYARKDRMTPVMIACARGHVEIVRLFCSLKCAIESIDVSNNTALHHSIAGGSVECAEAVLAHHKRLININNGFHETPLQMALSTRRPSFIDTLIKFGANVGDDEYMIAVERRDCESLNTLLGYSPRGEPVKEEEESVNNNKKKSKKNNVGATTTTAKASPFNVKAPSITVFENALASGSEYMVSLFLRMKTFSPAQVGKYVSFPDLAASSKKMLEDYVAGTFEVKEEGEDGIRAGARRQRNE